MYQSHHTRSKAPQHKQAFSIQKASHQKESNLESQVKKGAVLGVALAGTGVFATTLGGGMAGATTVTSSAVAAPSSAAVAQQTSSMTAAQISQEALLVIRGDLGNGDERIQALQSAGYDAAVVQSQVNQDLAGQFASAESVAVSAAPAPAPSSSTQTAAPSASASLGASTNIQSGITGINLSQTSGMVSPATLATYMSQHVGGAASTWYRIIMAESGGNVAAQNPTSTAYGVFQELTCPPGASLGTQINIAAHLYYVQGFYGAWLEWE